MATKVQITFDAHDAYALTSWWAALLGYEMEDVHDRVAGLLERGIVTEEEYREHPGERWTVMQDPEGNEFCLH